MATQIKILSEQIYLVGDGVATEARLSIYNYPFNCPKGLAITGFVAGGLGNKIASMALDGTDVVFTFITPFSGDAAPAQCTLLFDIPA